jgi:hypothetical protein
MKVNRNPLHKPLIPFRAMRCTAALLLLVLGALGVVGGTHRSVVDRPARRNSNRALRFIHSFIDLNDSTTNGIPTRSITGRRQSKGEGTPQAAKEYDKGFVSIPQRAPDPRARARRLGHKSQHWDFVPYSQTVAGSITARITTAAPGGILGAAQLQAETALVRGRILANSQEGQLRIRGPITATCSQVRNTAAAVYT